MKTYVLNQAGNPEQLQLIEVEKPAPADNEVLVKVKALSINPVDVKLRQGKSLYSELIKNGPITIGWDIAGVVEAVGKNVTEFEIDDAVFGMVNFPGHGKGYAEFVAAPSNHLAKKPETISFEEAAGATLAALTAYQILNRHVKPNDSVLIHAASGGVGHFAVQIAKIIGAKVTAITSSKNVDFVKSLGADVVIDYTLQAFEEIIKDQDFVLEALSGDNLKRSLTVVKKGGTIITLPSGGIDEEIIELSKEKGITVSFEIVESNGNDQRQIADWQATGKLKTYIHEVFPFEKLIEAHRQIETGRTRGKVIVTL